MPAGSRSRARRRGRESARARSSTFRRGHRDREGRCLVHYYYWLDEEKAPDFARTVDIHRKPGYDPAELFVDPKLKFPALRVAMRLAQKALGFRMLMDVIPLDASLVKGSHGRVTDDKRQGPIFASTEGHLLPDGDVSATQVKDLLLSHVFDA